MKRLREKEAGRGGVERSGMEPPGERSGAPVPSAYCGPGEPTEAGLVQFESVP